VNWDGFSLIRTPPAPVIVGRNVWPFEPGGRCLARPVRTLRPGGRGFETEPPGRAIGSEQEVEQPAPVQLERDEVLRGVGVSEVSPHAEPGRVGAYGHTIRITVEEVAEDVGQARPEHGVGEAVQPNLVERDYISFPVLILQQHLQDGW
jgi:hypothetical protein